MGGDTRARKKGDPREGVAAGVEYGLAQALVCFPAPQWSDVCTISQGPVWNGWLIKHILYA